MPREDERVWRHYILNLVPICWIHEFYYLQNLKVKCYLRYQTIFLPWSSPWCLINEFFHLKKKCFVLEIFRCLCFCEIYWLLNLWRHHGHYCIMEVTFAYFFWILSTIKMKFDQISVCLKQTFLTCFWLNAGEWELVPGPVIFCGWFFPFSILPYSLFLINETLKTWHDWLSSNWSMLLNCKQPGT